MLNLKIPARPRDVCSDRACQAGVPLPNSCQRQAPRSLPLLKHAYDQVINTWDTADGYSNGESERIIGKASKQYNIPRSKLVIMSKCYFPVATDGSQPRIFAMNNNDGPMVNQVGLSRKHIFDAVQASVERLGTYIDVLQIHRLDRDAPAKEIMKALHDVFEKGQYFGANIRMILYCDTDGR
jgi:aryl-alcohol dehydrogenase-like predicted oxidoreductase